MAQSVIDAQFSALTTHVTVGDILPSYEIDGILDADFGNLYRVWRSCYLLGTFYQALDGRWVAKSVKATINGSFSTEIQAILILVAIYENPQLQDA
jgi:hypothetical protein